VGCASFLVRPNTKAQLSFGWADRTAHIRRSASNFRSRKESDFPECLPSNTRYGDAAISNVTINAGIRYGNSAHVDDGCRQKHCIQNCGQTAADKNIQYLLL